MKSIKKMNEFEIISSFFKNLTPDRDDVILGPGDDAACLDLPKNHYLLVSTDTLVANRHFLSCWDAYDIAYKAVMVNVSDMAAMAAKPLWLTMSITLPDFDEGWMRRFASGLKKALDLCQVSLVGGDLTKGPLTIGVTIHGAAPKGSFISRKNAKPGDSVFVTGPLGGPAFVVESINDNKAEGSLPEALVKSLKNPFPRIDFRGLLQNFATSAIDISDGLSSDLKHICDASVVGAVIHETKLPVNAYLKDLCPERALTYALNGGDEYELCLTVSAAKEEQFLSALIKSNQTCYKIGTITSNNNYQIIKSDGTECSLQPKGYHHF